MNLKHGERHTRLYTIWTDMKQRCYSPSFVNKYWQIHGIIVIPEWQKYENFRDWALKSGYEGTLTIDRRDNNGNYEPSNCQWITLSENSGKDKRRIV